MPARGGYAAAEEPDGGEPDPAPAADQVVVVPGVVVDVAVGVVVVVRCGPGLRVTVGVGAPVTVTVK
ncbi:MAG TPA: hypothetical protein VIG79_00810 [Lapillicoccus sp.]|uniref:hypothetical protein n=1 Tax=Lapillicoccus sp. TaxID=1909287 RepID=UPI002F95EA36